MLHAVELPPPRDWQVFEDFCRDLFAAEWSDPNAQKYGRSGQPQQGVDVFGCRNGRWQGVQCKRRSTFPEKQLTKKEVRAEVTAAEKFVHPLETLVVATTVPPDTHLQALATHLTQEHGDDGPRVVVYGWSELCEKLQKHPELFDTWRQRLLGPRLEVRYWNVPYRRNPYFTGREDVLDTLHEALTEEDSVARGQAISGLGGVGKTQTAVEYAYRYRATYTAVLWTRAETETELASGFVEIAHELKLDEKGAQEQDVAIEAVRRWLATHEGWLLVLDNVEVPELVEQFVPKAVQGRVLATSRGRVFETLGIRGAVNLKSLPPKQAASFLLERTGRKDADADERSAAAAVAKELGYLPLALEQAGAFINTRRARFADYLKSLLSRRLEVLEQAKPILAEYPASVATTWALNFEQVETDSKAAADVLRLSAFLAPERIPLSVLIEGAPKLGTNLAEALANVIADPLRLDETLEPLIRFSLIERDPEQQTYDIHRLVQVVARETLESKTERIWAERAVCALNCAFPIGDLSTWDVCEKLLPHVTASVSLIDEYALDIQDAGDLLNKSGVYLHASGHYRLAVAFFERSQSVLVAVTGYEHPYVATSLNNLANCHLALGEYEQAEGVLKKSLRISVNVSGATHPEAATRLNNLGNVYRALGAYEKARPLIERAIGIREEAFGSEDMQVASSLNDLALLHRDTEDYDSARPLFERALRIRERTLRQDDPEVAQSLHNLALLSNDQGSYEEAQRLYERALALQEEVLGPKHADVATTLHNLGSLYHEQGRLLQAQQLYERSLQIREEVLGPEHPSVAQCLFNLASLHASQGEDEIALALYKRSLKIRKRVLGPDHPRVASIVEEYARLLRKTGRLQPGGQGGG